MPQLQTEKTGREFACAQTELNTASSTMNITFRRRWTEPFQILIIHASCSECISTYNTTLQIILHSVFDFLTPKERSTKLKLPACSRIHIYTLIKLHIN